MSLCLLCLIFIRVCGWLVLRGRSTASKDIGAARAAARVAVLRRTKPRPGLGVGRPRGPRRADPPPAAKAADAPAGHLGHRPAVAPPLGHPEVDLPAPDGPAPVSAEIAGLIERLATGNNGWGYQRIQGELLTVSSVTGSARRRSAGFSRPRGFRRHRNGAPTPRGGSSCARKPRPCSPPTSSTWDCAVTLRRPYCLFLIEVGPVSAEVCPEREEGLM